MVYTTEELQNFFNVLDDSIALAASHHPNWDYYTYTDMASLCMEEVGEVARALNDNADIDDLLIEVAHVAVVAARMYMEIQRKKEKGNGQNMQIGTRTCSCGSCKCHKRGAGKSIRQA